MQKGIFFGSIAAFSLLAFYALVMIILTKSYQAAIEQFQTLWWIMIPLAIGFGIQVGLYTKLKQSGTTVAAGGTSAGIGMVACCAHHLADVLPLIGLAGVSIFLSQFQIPILVISLFINLLGIFIMFKHLHKSQSVILGSEATPESILDKPE